MQCTCVSDLLPGKISILPDCVWMFFPIGEETDMFRADMSGFKAKGDVATLIGAPKGYQDSVCPHGFTV